MRNELDDDRNKLLIPIKNNYNSQIVHKEGVYPENQDNDYQQMEVEEFRHMEKEEGTKEKCKCLNSLQNTRYYIKFFFYPIIAVNVILVLGGIVLTTLAFVYKPIGKKKMCGRSVKLVFPIMLVMHSL